MTEEKKIKPKATYVKYVDRSRYISGIPARDLTLAEWRDLPAGTQKHLTKVLGLYEVKYD